MLPGKWPITCYNELRSVPGEGEEEEGVDGAGKWQAGQPVRHFSNQLLGPAAQAIINLS